MEAVDRLSTLVSLRSGEVVGIFNAQSRKLGWYPVIHLNGTTDPEGWHRVVVRCTVDYYNGSIWDDPAS